MVRGLATFVERNTHLTKDFELKDTALVIDGQALQRFLFDSSESQKKSAKFAGDYIEYGKNVRRFFAALQLNRVKPYVVLSGGKKPRNSKGNRQQEISNRNFDRYMSHQGDEQEYQLKPLLCSFVLSELMNEMRIPHARTLFEEDPDVVSVANELGCPILSNQSDYYLFDVSGGFVYFPTLKFNVDGDPDGARDSLSCRIFYYRDFIACFKNMDKKCLALFSAASGNAIRPREEERDGPFFAMRKLPNVLESSFHASSQWYLVKLLNWLDGRKFDDAMRRFCHMLLHNDARQFREAVDSTVEFYACSGASGCLLQHLEGVECAEDHSFTLEDKTTTKTLSDKLVRKVISQGVSSSTINVLLNEYLYTVYQADDLEQESSFTVAVGLFKCFLSMLRESEDDSMFINVQGWKTRKETGLPDIHTESMLLLPRTELANRIKLPLLQELDDMDTDEKRVLLLAILGISQAEVTLMKRVINEDLGLVLDDQDDLKDHLTVLLCVLMYTLAKQQDDEKRTLFKKFAKAQIVCSTFYLCDAVVEGVSREDIVSLGKETDHPVRKDIVHCFTQLQAVIRMFSQVNALLSFPFAKLPISKMFNGVLAHNLVADDVNVVVGENLDTLLEWMFG